MMRPLGLLRIFAAGAAVWLAAPAAMAGNDVVKCVDRQGHVTLTDQPCEAGSASVRLAAGAVAAPVAVQEASAAYGASSGGSTGSGGPDAAPERPAAQRHVIPAAELRHSTWRPPAPAARQAAPLARDVATLKAARRALMLMEGPPPSLAGLP